MTRNYELDGFSSRSEPEFSRSRQWHLKVDSLDWITALCAPRQTRRRRHSMAVWSWKDVKSGTTDEMAGRARVSKRSPKVKAERCAQETASVAAPEAGSGEDLNQPGSVSGDEMKTPSAPLPASAASISNEPVPNDLPEAWSRLSPAMQYHLAAIMWNFLPAGLRREMTDVIVAMGTPTTTCAPATTSGATGMDRDPGHEDDGSSTSS